LESMPRSCLFLLLSLPLLLSAEPEALLRERFYSQPRRLVSRVGDDGAVSVNRGWKPGREEPFYIEQQRYAVDVIQAGLLTENEPLLRKGIRILDWGFARQGPEGNFPGSGDPLHSSSFFVEASARAALLLQQSERKELQAKALSWKPKIHAAARWMIRPEERQRRPHLDLEPYTHRYYLRAAALLQSATLTEDPALFRAGDAYLQEALKLQQPGGINPEKGGLDVSYQGVGIFYAQLCWLHSPLPARKQELEAMMTRAWAPLLAKLDEQGLIQTEGSSRAQELGRSGTPKRVAYRLILPALLRQSRISQDPRYRELAQRMTDAVWPE